MEASSRRAGSLSDFPLNLNRPAFGPSSANVFEITSVLSNQLTTKWLRPQELSMRCRQSQATQITIQKSGECNGSGMMTAKTRKRPGALLRTPPPEGELEPPFKVSYRVRTLRLRLPGSRLQVQLPHHPSTSTGILPLGMGMGSFGHLEKRIKGKDYERKLWNNKWNLEPLPSVYLVYIV